MRKYFVVWMTLIFVCVAVGRTSAEPIAIAASLSLNFLDGSHNTTSGSEQITFVPLPLGDIDARYRGTTLHLEGLPGLTFGYGDGEGGTQYTRLSIVNVVLRQSLGGGFFAGAGQTVYNQSTIYPQQRFSVIAVQSSRVTGARFEGGYSRHLFGSTGVEGVFALNPGMRGVEYTALYAPFNRLTGREPERAVQVDTAIRFSTHFGHGDLVYGVRYLNYISRYDLRYRFINGLLADRNVGVLPLIGYRRHF